MTPPDHVPESAIRMRCPAREFLRPRPAIANEHSVARISIHGHKRTPFGSPVVWLAPPVGSRERVRWGDEAARCRDTADIRSFVELREGWSRRSHVTHFGMALARTRMIASERGDAAEVPISGTAGSSSNQQPRASEEVTPPHRHERACSGRHLHALSWPADIVTGSGAPGQTALGEPLGCRPVARPGWPAPPRVKAERWPAPGLVLVPVAEAATPRRAEDHREWSWCAPIQASFGRSSIARGRLALAVSLRYTLSETDPTSRATSACRQNPVVRPAPPVGSRGRVSRRSRPDSARLPRRPQGPRLSRASNLRQGSFW